MAINESRGRGANHEGDGLKATLTHFTTHIKVPIRLAPLLIENNVDFNNKGTFYRI